MSVETNHITSPAAHYDEAYFAWQVTKGSLAGTLNGHIYSPYIKPSDSIMDFGCGGGFLLAALNSTHKLGVEINPAARACATRIGVETVATLSEVPDESVDVAISCHALEHTEAPLDALRTVRNKIKPGGRAVFVVPCERYDTEYDPDNIDLHLYTWSPVNIGNLFRCAGFDIESVERIAHRWPPGVVHIYRYLGLAATHLACRLYARLAPRLTQVRVVARKVSS